MRPHRPPDKKIGGLLEEAAEDTHDVTPSLCSRNYKNKQRSSVEIVSEIQKSYSSRLRISLSSWRGKNNIEIRECSSVIDGIYFPTAQGISVEINLLPELIEALKVTLTEAKKRGLLAKAG